MHNQFKTQKFKHLMLAMGPTDLNFAPYSPVHCSSHSMTSFQSSELTELPVVENSQLFAQRAHSARYALTDYTRANVSTCMHAYVYTRGHAYTYISGTAARNSTRDSLDGGGDFSALRRAVHGQSRLPQIGAPVEALHRRRAPEPEHVPWGSEGAMRERRGTGPVVETHAFAPKRQKPRLPRAASVLGVGGGVGGPSYGTPCSPTRPPAPATDPDPSPPSPKMQYHQRNI